jgi:hypothetical protein
MYNKLVGGFKMKKTIKLELLPLEKVDFLKDVNIPEGTTRDDFTFVSIQIGTKKDMTLIGAKYDNISNDELTALVFQSITESLYNKCHPETQKTVVDGKEVELTQEIQ